MKPRAVLIAGIAATLVAFGQHAKADTVQLANGDILRGKVVSLNDKQLVFHSDSFGEIKIERSKVGLIALGTTPLPSVKLSAMTPPNEKPSSAPPTTSKGGIGSLLGGASPLLGGGSLGRGGAESLGPGIDQLLGAGGVGDLQKNVDNAKRGLQDLKKDFGNGPEGQAIDAYINLLNQFGAIGALAGQSTHPTPPPPPAQHVKPPENVKKPKADANKAAK
jgi:hypothetical protein